MDDNMFGTNRYNYAKIKDRIAAVFNSPYKL